MTTFPSYLLNKRFHFKCANNYIGHRENLEIVLTFKQNFKQKLYLVAIDKVLTEFRDRLTNYSDLSDLLVCFDPDSEDFLNPKLAVNLRLHYDSHFDVVALENLRNQTATAKHFMRSKHLKYITDIFTELNVIPAAFDQLIK